MRMSPEHYDMLNKKLTAYLDTHPEINIKQALASMRARWDIYWASKGSFSNAQEYQYLTDNHIDTALKSILEHRVARKGPLYPHVTKSQLPKYGGSAFNAFYKLIEADYHRQGEYDEEKIMGKAITDVLDGYRDRAEAMAEAEMMLQTGGRRYSPTGYEFNSEVVYQAVKEADARHYFGPIRPDMVEKTVVAKKQAQRVAITEQHPAVKHLEELWNELNWGEMRAVNKKAPGKVAGYNW